MTEVQPISSARLSLIALAPDLLARMVGDAPGDRPFEWPTWWPDDTDRSHLQMWRDRAAADPRNVVWGARAVVDAATNEMVGHAGFHRRPQPLTTALDDPTFVGDRVTSRDPSVEIGYTIFPEHRGHGYATEAVQALVDWAARSGEVRVVVATVARDNDASVRVLDRVGGFIGIGTCRNDDDEVEIVYRRDL